MNNYPPGVGNSTYGAPFNDIEVEAEVEVSLSLSISLQGPDPEYADKARQELNRIVKEELVSLLSKHHAFNDLEILNIQIL